MRLFNLDRNSRLAGVLALACCAAQPSSASTVGDGLNPPSAQVQSTLPRYLQSRSAHFVDWLSDGSALIATRFGDTEQIHRVRIPLGAREQLSFAAGGVAAALARPYASDALVYLEPLHGGQSAQLFMQSLDTHERKAVTDGNHRDGPALWAHDGKHLAFPSNRVNGNDTEIYEVDTDAPAATPRLLAGGSGNRWRVFDWSGDDRRVLLGREPGSAQDAASLGSDLLTDAQLFIADVGSGEINPVNASGGADGRSNSHGKASAALISVLVRQARFATDGHGIVMLTRQPAPGRSSASASGAARLAYLDLHDGQWRDLSASSSHDVERFAQSADGHYVAYTLNENDTDQLMLIDQTRKLDLRVPQLPQGVIGNLKFDQSGQRLGLSIESTHFPADVWVYEPETHALTQWTHSEVGPLETSGFTLPQTLRFPTWDRVGDQPRELSARVFRGASDTLAGGPRPVVISLCAEGSQCAAAFDPFVQYLVNELGVVVVAPTLRGSLGSGVAVPQVSTDQLREDAVRDVGSLLVWIGLQRELDRNRVAVLGEGFGAYVTLQALGDYGDRLRGGVAAFAPHQSALGHSSAIRRPVLLVQGLNNPTAPPYELDQLRARLRAEGVEVQSLAAADEGDTFNSKLDRDAYREAAASFLSQLLH